MRQVTFLVEGARAVITHHQVSLPPTDATLIIVFLIPLPRQTWRHGRLHSYMLYASDRKGFLVVPYLIVRYGTKWDYLMSLKTRPSCCFMKDGAEWGHCLMNKLTWSSSSGLHRLQLHSREWIVRVSAWNRQGGLLFLQSIVIRSF